MICKNCGTETIRESNLCTTCFEKYTEDMFEEVRRLKRSRKKSNIYLAVLLDIELQRLMKIGQNTKIVS